MQDFEILDYRTLLQRALREKKSLLGNSFTNQLMAQNCHIQSTYLSKVLNCGAHLNSDQLYYACDYLGFGADARQFIFLLFEEQKTTVEKRRKELQQQIRMLQEKAIRSESRLDAKVVEDRTDDYSDYYLDPLCQIVHMFLTIERFAVQAHLVGDVLKLHSEVLAEVLRKLQRMGIIELTQSRFRVVHDNLHLSKDATLYRPYRNLLRYKSLEWLNTLPIDKSYNFSAVFSSDSSAKLKIQSLFLDFLKEVQLLAKAGKSDQVFQLNFDLFEWTEG